MHLFLCEDACASIFETIMAKLVLIAQETLPIFFLKLQV